ncbi:hypothetical protein [Nocardioides sp. zg-DK7169]|uniref:hypothetical protein n=1 Tax=Nocardioides sp. zg-DK7169 TaxID=2736600 RepID=UPI001554F4E4|nr:hypothetical protein [Nocardioides sp. zg-DK7169]NPC98950.1 hypothetical protein [Nocardioides sp. zg-DK7169]
MRRRRVVVGVAAVLVVALLAVAAVVGVGWWRDSRRTDLARALDLAAPAERYSFTDWAGVRRALDVPDDAGTDARTLRRMLDDGYDADLTSASALEGSAELLRARYGWSPADLDWELLAQAEDGVLVVAALGEDTDVDDLADRLAGLGYERPGEDDGVWRGGEELVARISAQSGLTGSPVLQYVALDADAGVVRTSDSAAYLEAVLAGDLGAPEEVDDVVGAAGDALSAAVYTGRHACTALAMSQADEIDQASAEQLVEQAGGVSPVRAYAMAVRPARDLVVAMSFEDGERARRNADARAVLAAGPAPGQGGAFTDRFELGDVSADDGLVRLDLDPVDGASVFSDLSTGPVLFATC